MIRVIWQYRTDVGEASSENLLANDVPVPRDDDKLLDGVELVDAPEPVFSKPSPALRIDVFSRSESFRRDPASDFAAYYHAFTKDRPSAERLVRRLREQPTIRYADLQPRIEPAFIIDERRRRKTFETSNVNPAFLPQPTPNLESMQAYLNPAPDGIDARYAWGRAGGQGDGVTIIDIESGWNFAHEDLRGQQIGVIHGANSNHDHGTAVLGIYSGDRNGQGITGIAPIATAGAASAIYDSVNQKWNAADAIRAAADRLKSGDIILLEMHAPGPNSNGSSEQQGYIPVEYWDSEYAAVRYATDRGIYVVEAAGNGGENLDHTVYGSRFSRQYRDSLAVLVGGGASPQQSSPRSRIWWSNYGSRLDVQGWGEDIVTTGGRSGPYYYDLVNSFDPSRCYTQSFGGTSGASPIVVGAIACIAGCRSATGQSPLTPLEMRNLLMSTGTPQSDGSNAASSESIGPLPDLRRALSALK